MSVYTPFPPLAGSADADPACTLWHVGRALGCTGASDGALVAYVQELVDGCGFPPPFPSRIKGKGLTRAVTRHSTFRRDAVDAWLGDFLPPACASALDAAALAQAAAEMDHAAARLGKLTLIDGGRA